MLAGSSTTFWALKIAMEIHKQQIFVSEGEKSYPYQLILTAQVLIITHHQRRTGVIELHMHVSLFSLLYTIQGTISSLAINDTIFSLLVNSAV